MKNKKYKIIVKIIIKFIIINFIIIKNHYSLLITFDAVCENNILHFAIQKKFELKTTRTSQIVKMTNFECK